MVNFVFRCANFSCPNLFITSKIRRIIKIKLALWSKGFIKLVKKSFLTANYLNSVSQFGVPIKKFSSFNLINIKKKKRNRRWKKKLKRNLDQNKKCSKKGVKARLPMQR